MSALQILQEALASAFASPIKTAFTVVALLGAYLILSIVNVYRRAYHKYACLQDMPGRPQWPIIGSIINIPLDPLKREESFNKLAREYGHHGVLQFWNGPIPGVEVLAPDTIRAVLSAAREHHAKGYFYRLLEPWLGGGLLLLDGDEYRIHRQWISRSFHVDFLRTSFLEVMLEKTDLLVERITKHIKDSGEPFDAFQWLSETSMNIICQTSMGLNLQTETISSQAKYKEALEFTKNMFYARAFNVLMHSDTIFHYSKLGREFRGHLATIRSFSNELIQKRRKLLEEGKVEVVLGSAFSMPSDLDSDAGATGHGADNFGLAGPSSPRRRHRMTLLDSLLMEQKRCADPATRDPGETPLTDEQLRVHVDTFIFAGHDTIATFAAWALYCAAKYPEATEPLLRELDAFWQELGSSDPDGTGTGRSPTMAELNELRELDMFIKEVMRLYPSAPQISRIISRDIELRGHHVPAGTSCNIQVWALHRNPTYWPNPLKFDPTRFSPENSAGRDPFAFIPFSAGVRSCVGRKFAELEQRVLVARLLHQFRFKMAPGREHVVGQPRLALSPIGGIHVLAFPREPGSPAVQ
ncbi:hypothetical protein H696_01036 [Fonticula alba]|uniref:Cytochrome P450 n=1 Tax=Fonticula alba TaxID=691883 RepID=A0A058ZB45_FONAL|nr:hypothetical protein H696_01036 [Fonticula alba]KCV71619.1 hypothetical protein H696_01036 [Fonticula alba]|eukprot:XP_009493197.1 hypothetical protein H696_01036 [Fonticula alba]